MEETTDYSEQHALAAEARSFDQFYAVQDQSPTLKAIFREVLELADLPAEIAPYSFVSRDDVQRIESLLHLTQGQSFADLACGNGSLGLWLAQRTGANLIGVDVSTAALELAREKAKTLGLEARSKFVSGSLDQTDLESHSFDAVVSTDAIWLAADQPKALREIARLLRPGAKFVFTSWEQRIPMPFVKQPVKDYRPLLKAAGFEIEVYEYLTHSEELEKKIYERIRNSQTLLLEEMGEAIKGLIGEAHFVPGLVDGVNYISPENGPHVLVSAKRVELKQHVVKPHEE